jgi:hypothetical protein
MTLNLEFATDAKMCSKVFKITMEYHFFKSHIGEEKGIMIHKIESAEHKADIFTKGLPEATFRIIRQLLTC